MSPGQITKARSELQMPIALFLSPACIKLMLAAVALYIIDFSIAQVGQEETMREFAKQLHNLHPYNREQFDS